MENGADLHLVLVCVVSFSRSYMPRLNCMLTLPFRVNGKSSVRSHKHVNYIIVAKNQIGIDLCVW
jgi:hypothetical protein